VRIAARFLDIRSEYSQELHTHVRFEELDLSMRGFDLYAQNIKR